ncbi:unnamed protein product [Dovyalis caffra]|uniref:Uncharacterized protein n=1 Tax=Dovyalis caffra TaxID=77055 RepID=A0AAV1RMJ8_9ROSI|nr:unnamed protein product [Dovyalis caffra]
MGELISTIELEIRIAPHKTNKLQMHTRKENQYRTNSSCSSNNNNINGTPQTLQSKNPRSKHH